ncbi:hypothetical protein NBCG_01648 [Nocardioidaceae bacterium Broad-1]|nr:hypothetical protein NBCG_01648 [Nocardioidaceae bacterium Broad-1]
MNVSDAFGRYQSHVDADPASVTEGRRRGNLFKSAFEGLDDVQEVFISGSLARKTHKKPINDVDVVIVFNRDAHLDWGQPGTSAGDALQYTGAKVNELLGATNGAHDQLVRLARPGNHAVKCFVDDPEDPDRFTVDAMPAFRTETGLLIPEKTSTDWVPADPEYLIGQVAARSADWAKYLGTVRMLKTWGASRPGIEIKSLVMEVLALQFLPHDGTTQPIAIKEFFVRAANYIEEGYEVTDPAGICGPVQSSLDYDKFAECLREAATRAGVACSRQAVSDDAAAIRLWGEVFGDGFPPPTNAPGKPGIIPPVVPEKPRPVKDTPQG